MHRLSYAVLVAAFLCVAGQVHAQEAEDSGPEADSDSGSENQSYLAVKLGILIPQEPTVQGIRIVDQEIYGTSPSVSIAFGSFGDPVGTEAELTLAVPDNSLVGFAMMFLFNGYFYPARTQDRFRPRVGAGVGFVTYTHDTLENGQIREGSGIATNFAAAVRLGFDYQVAENLYIGPGYQYLWVNSGDIIDDFTAHHLQLTVRFPFGS